MPKFMDHLQTSNNSLTIKWNTNAGNDEGNLMEYQTMVSLPKKEGRNFVLKGLLHNTHMDDIHTFLHDNGIPATDIRPKGRLEGMDDKENFKRNGQFGEWIIKVDYSMKPSKMDLGTYADAEGQKPIYLFPANNQMETSIKPVKISYPFASISYRNVLTNQQTPSPLRTLTSNQVQGTEAPPQKEMVLPQTEVRPCFMQGAQTPKSLRKGKKQHNPTSASKSAMRTPGSARKRIHSASKQQGKTAKSQVSKSPRKLLTEFQEKATQPLSDPKDLELPEFGVALDPGPSHQNPGDISARSHGSGQTETGKTLIDNQLVPVTDMDQSTIQPPQTMTDGNMELDAGEQTVTNSEGIQRIQQECPDQQ